MGSKNLSFWENSENFSPVTANSSASNWPVLVFLSCPQASWNREKPKRNYMTADGHTKNF